MKHGVILKKDTRYLHRESLATTYTELDNGGTGPWPEWIVVGPTDVLLQESEKTTPEGMRKKSVTWTQNEISLVRCAVRPICNVTDSHDLARRLPSSSVHSQRLDTVPAIRSQHVAPTMSHLE